MKRYIIIRHRRWGFWLATFPADNPLTGQYLWSLRIGWLEVRLRRRAHIRTSPSTYGGGRGE